MDVLAFKLSFDIAMLVFFGHFFPKLGELLFELLVTLNTEGEGHLRKREDKLNREFLLKGRTQYGLPPH